MKKYLLGAFIMMLLMKPAVGLALFSIFAEGMQTAAAAMANGAPAYKIDAAASNSFAPPMPTLIPIEQADTSSNKPLTRQQAEELFEDKVMAIIEKKQLHEEEQVENQRRLAEAEATRKAEKAGVELFDEEFNKKFPVKR